MNLEEFCGDVVALKIKLGLLTKPINLCVLGHVYMYVYIYDTVRFEEQNLATILIPRCSPLFVLGVAICSDHRQKAQAII